MEVVEAGDKAREALYEHSNIERYATYVHHHIAWIWSSRVERLYSGE